jgi:hypothetical protein
LVSAIMEGNAKGQSTTLYTSTEAEDTTDIVLATEAEAVAKSLYGLATGTSYWTNRWSAASMVPTRNCIICIVVRVRLMVLGTLTPITARAK